MPDFGQDEHLKENLPATFYMDPNEEQRAILGQGYITSLLTGGGLSKSIMVLTNRRLYVDGKSFQRNSFSKFTALKGKKNVEVDKINSTAYEEVDPVALKWFAYVMGGLGALFFLLGIAALGEGEGGDAGGGLAISVGMMAVAGLLYGKYRSNKKKYFIVEFSGGSMATDCNWYGNPEIENFQRKIYQEQERIRSLAK